MPTYPYTSGQTALVAAFEQLRKGFPPTVDAGYLKRFNIAPANESYIISILRFLGLIDEGGARVEKATGYFFGNDDAFQAGLVGSLRDSYAQLFDEMGDGALGAQKGVLTHWFRAADKTSDLVGQRQASTFQTLAALAGHGEMPSVRAAATKKAAAGTAPAKKAPAKKTATKKAEAKPVETRHLVGPGTPKVGGEVGLTVRVEVNLPPGGDSDTYDAIFASIKKHLMS